MKKTVLQKITFVCLILFLALLFGCTTTSKNSAKLRYDDHVKRDFENFIVIPNYDYYYYGSIDFPKAFVGISKKFTLASDAWQPIVLTSDQLHSWIWGYANRTPGNMQSYGSKIVGPNGEHIGVWYSLQNWKQWAKIELHENKVVRIGGPIDMSNTLPLFKF